MANDYRFTCPLQSGMHARPASALEHVARRFTCDVSIVNGRTGQSANAKSVLGIVGLDIRQGDPCRVLTVGRDAAWAIESLRVFVERTLPHVDDAPPAPEREPDRLELPPVLRQAGAVVTPGVAVAAGIGIGHAFAVAGFGVPDSIPLAGVEDVDAEVRLVEEAFGRMLQRYDERIAAGDGRVEADVLRAHRSVARDPEFSQAIVHAMRAHRHTAAGAVMEAEAQFSGMLAATGSALLRERALDIRDVCRDLLAEVYGPALREQPTVLTRDSVCLADTLTPGQFLSLDRRWLRGLVMAHGGTTSHTVILARSHAVPTIVGVAGLDAAALEGQEVVVDADLGVMVSKVTDAARRYYRMEQHRLDRRRQRVQRFAERPAATEDGRRIEVAANIGSAADVQEAVACGAEGIGLFRTEMLFLARKDPPGEDEQFEEYRRALAFGAGRPVIVRTLDVGGDKPLPYLALPREDNPFLGYRAVRIYREFDTLFRTQVRALVRASAFGALRVMIPMVASLDEVRWVRGVIAEEQDALEAHGVAFDRRMPVGAMIEVPAAAFMVGGLSRALDFFSIGTNDLLQYFLAADRSNPRLTPLANPLEPSFLRLLDQVVTEAHANGRWVGLCGDLGGQARYLPLLVGLGLDEVSMAIPEVASTKALLSGLSAARCRALLDDALRASTAGEVAQRLDDRGHWRAQPLLEPELVSLDVEAHSKEEAIKAAVDLLFAAGRTDRPREVENAVWQRESTYSTGFGNRFAIPHCKTDAMGANSMAIVRLRDDVAWGALDGQPVRTVILLAVRETGQAAEHMRVLAALARRLMHEEFRDEVERAQDATGVCAALGGVTGTPGEPR
jgi:multiphosphoryl transfer protein